MNERFHAIQYHESGIGHVHVSKSDSMSQVFRESNSNVSLKINPDYFLLPTTSISHALQDIPERKYIFLMSTGIFLFVCFFFRNNRTFPKRQFEPKQQD